MVILDNASLHRAQVVRERFAAWEQRGLFVVRGVLAVLLAASQPGRGVVAQTQIRVVTGRRLRRRANLALSRLASVKGGRQVPPHSV